MAYYRRYRRRFRGRRRYGRRRYRRSYARRYVNGSSRSTIRMKCNQTQTTTAAAGHHDAATGADIWRIRPYANEDTSLTHNPLYQAYLSLYEETKLIGMKVNLSVTSQIGGVDTPSLQIYTAWDRRHGYDDAVPTVAQVKAAATSTVATALNNNVAKLSRSIYASDLMEKAQWHDSTVAAYVDQAWQTAGNNPNFFCPAFLFFFNSPSLAAAHDISFSISVTYYVAFRNPKFGGTVSSSKELPLKGASLSATDDLRSQVPAGYESLYDFMLKTLDYTPEHALARCNARYAEEHPAAAAAAMADDDGDDDVGGPAELGKRQRSNASQVAMVPDAQRPKNA